MKLNGLCIKDRLLFQRYLGLKAHELSVYAFEDIYIWRSLFDIQWALVNKSLCIFFRDNIGAFLYLSPLSLKHDPAALQEAFHILDGVNKNADISRIENAEEGELGFYRREGFDCRLKSHDYLCSRADLAALSGNRFKSKRASSNYFVKNYRHEYFDFSLKHKDACCELFDAWALERRSKSQDDVYSWCLSDTRMALEELLGAYKKLKVLGRLVAVDKKIKAFTFGYELNKDTFCILYEVADLSVKGIAQFVFAEFCRELKKYRYINVMDDSGLANLKAVKLSYKPARLVPAYIVKRHA